MPDNPLRAFLKAFEEFTEAEYGHIRQCYQLVDPEDDSQTAEDAVEDTCDEATERMGYSNPFFRHPDCLNSSLFGFLFESWNRMFRPCLLQQPRLL